MESHLSNQFIFRSRLSFLPLVKTWETIARTNEGSKEEMCRKLVEEFLQHPELLEVIDDYEILKQHAALVDRAMNTIFTEPLCINEVCSAVVTPFSNKIICASEVFRKQFMDTNSNVLLPLEKQVASNIDVARKKLAYKMILQKFYNVDLAGGLSFICAYPQPQADIHNYFELTWNPRFIEVLSCISLPKLPEEIILKCHHVDELIFFPQLNKLLPLDEFIFDGLLLININEVTDREVVNTIRTLLEEDDSLEKAKTFEIVKQQIGHLLQIKEMEVGISSFSENVLGEDLIEQPLSLLLQKGTSVNEWRLLSQFLTEQFSEVSYYKGGPDNIQTIFSVPVLQQWKCALFAPLYKKTDIIGCLEIYSNHPVKNPHKLRIITPYLQLALQKRETHFEERVDIIVKDHFTAIAPSVEWKFNQVAIQYLLELQQNGSAKMGAIVFENVYPLYAAIDIRNSSTERNHAIQHDVLQQLTWCRDILVKAKSSVSLPLLEEHLTQIDESIELVKNFLWSPDEHTVYSLLKNDLSEMLYTLQEMLPALNEEIRRYFDEVNKNNGLLKNQQHNYEQAVSLINHQLSELLTREQPDAQQVFPHYFEWFATDGVDFNMFIGQSITPKKKFSPLFLKNLRLWQLKTVAVACRHLQKFSSDLPMPLETTQLVLVYSQPINISFRPAERKFDVAGAYSARYEVVKKRIDKAYIKNTNERLTQPGTISIVYFNEIDVSEYLQHIAFLKKQNLLEGEVQKFELEEVQGVIGLKALRIGVKPDKESMPAGRKGIATAKKNVQN